MMKQQCIETRPTTKAAIIKDLSEIGVKPDMTLMVHSSLSAIGWVVGGAPTVVQALTEVIGDRGTLVMPAATPQCADPATWDEPTVAQKWLNMVRDNLPVYDPDITPTLMGAIAESFRTRPGTLRSDHPISSVCANGPLADTIISDHSIAFSEGEGTPFEKLYNLGCWILLLGVGFNRCTALHFAESRVESRRVTKSRFPILKDGLRVWLEVDDMANDNSLHFPIVGEQYIRCGRAYRGTVGKASSILVPMNELVEFASDYFRTKLQKPSLKPL